MNPTNGKGARRRKEDAPRFRESFDKVEPDKVPDSQKPFKINYKSRR